MKMLRLTELAVLKCSRHINQITDVGQLPYHLVKPILIKMNAKQLELVESNSPSICPFSDELWLALIKKDFPSRPQKTTSKLNNTSNRDLYRQYSEEQENFRRDSTARLKQLTQKLEREKSKNSVIQVDQMFRDPTVRVKSYSYGNKNGIINRAKKELQSNRSLMFPKKKLDSMSPILPRLNKPAPLQRQPTLKTTPVVPKSPNKGPRADSGVFLKSSQRPSKSNLESKLFLRKKRRPPPDTGVTGPDVRPDVKRVKSSVFND